eukprot:UN02775
MSAEEQLTNVQIAQNAAEVMPEEEVELNLEYASNIQLTKVEEVADDDEIDVFCERAALYRFAEEENDWKERARGDVQIVQSKSTGKYRALMRQEKTLKVRLNQQVGDVTLKPNAGSDKAWTWRWQDYATDNGEPEVHSFAIRFKNKEIADNFFQVWEKAREENKKIAAGAAPAAAATEEKKEEVVEEKKEEEAAPATE